MSGESLLPYEEAFFVSKEWDGITAAGVDAAQSCM